LRSRLPKVFGRSDQGRPDWPVPREVL